MQFDADAKTPLQSVRLHNLHNAKLLIFVYQPGNPLPANKNTLFYVKIMFLTLYNVLPYYEAIENCYITLYNIFLYWAAYFYGVDIKVAGSEFAS